MGEKKEKENRKQPHEGKDYRSYYDPEGYTTDLTSFPPFNPSGPQKWEGRRTVAQTGQDRHIYIKENVEQHSTCPPCHSRLGAELSMTTSPLRSQNPMRGYQNKKLVCQYKRKTKNSTGNYSENFRLPVDGGEGREGE